MKPIRHMLWLLLAAIALTGCDSNEKDLFVEELVVQGYLYIGYPLSIDISHTVPIDQFYDPAAVKVSGADVRIAVDGHEFQLVEQSPENPGTYALLSDSHIVTTGKRYDLWLEKGGTIITGTTLAAAMLHIDSTNLENTSFSDPDTIEYGDTEFYMHWNNNPANFGYFIIIENLEPDWFDEARTFGEDNGAGMSNVSAMSLRDTGEFKIPWVFLGSTGTHRVRVFSCEQALWDYATTTQLGIAENYPISNLSQGRGVFCAVGVDTAYFELVDWIEN
ncbi:MAG: DUF4249 family protein [bacterium]